MGDRFSWTVSPAHHSTAFHEMIHHELAFIVYRNLLVSNVNLFPSTSLVKILNSISSKYGKSKTSTLTMGILRGKDIALEHIEKSKLAFLAKLSEVEKGPSTNTMPPIDHFVLKFDRDTIRNLKGRVYENMKQYTYEQRGESIPAFINNQETEDAQGSLNPIKPEVPTVGHQYVACVYDDLKIVNYLIEIEWCEVDELVRTANARRKSII